MPIVFCRERDELEKRISDLLRKISENSAKASQIAQHEEPHSKTFAQLHEEDNLLRARLDALKSSLELHRDCHNC
jgi:hypothetical protein